MEIVCPSCRKANRGDACQRCGCDLSGLFAVRAAAGTWQAVAAHHLRNSAPGAAAEAAAKAWELQHTPEAARLGFLASISGGDFEMARRWLECCQLAGDARGI